MNRKSLVVLVAVNLYLLGGCATLSEDQCMVADWSQIGFTDGANGEPETYLQNHQKACAKHGVGTNLNDWLQGREAGLQRYCTAQRGFEEGVNNRTYKGVCLGEAGFQFESAYQDGQEIYHQQQLILDLENQLAAANVELLDLDEEWQYLKNQLRHSNLNQYERSDMINRLDYIKDRTADLNSQRIFMAGRLERERYVLNDMQR